MCGSRQMPMRRWILWLDLSHCNHPSTRIDTSESVQSPVCKWGQVQKVGEVQVQSWLLRPCLSGERREEEEEKEEGKEEGGRRGEEREAEVEEEENEQGARSDTTISAHGRGTRR